MRTATSLLTSSLTALAVLAGCTGECSEPSPATTDGAQAGAATDPTALAAPVAMTFAVKGMHCDGCEGAIRGKVEKIAGVTAVKASHVDMKVDVTAPESQRDAIVAAIKRLGYTVEANAAADSSTTRSN